MTTVHIRQAAAAGIAAAAIACASALGTVPASASSTTTARQQAASAATSCGYWRWPVKTGSDANRYQVSKTITYTSVGYLDKLAAPSYFTTWAQDHRIRWPEDRTWQIRGVTLVAIKLEADGDLHLRLRSSTGARMIAEIPRPSCVSSSSLWKAGITAARYYVTNRYWVSLYSWHYIYRSVNIQGLGFFDEEHSVTGAAPNDFELHPVTYIHLN
jgi:hypothetical protein